MRIVLSMLLVLVAAPFAGAEDAPAPKAPAKKVASAKAPSEKAAAAATRNFIRALNTVEGTDRVDALARHVDLGRVARRMFDGIDEMSSAERSVLQANIVRFLVFGLFEKMPRPDKATGIVLTSKALASGERQVDFRVGEENVRLVWVRGARAAMLVDFGNPNDGLMTSFARRLWKKSGASPSEFLESLLERKEPRVETAPIVKSIDNIRTLITLMIARRIGRMSGTYPPYDGKAFVVSLVATAQLDRRNPQNLDVLFSPGDKVLSLKKVDLEAYKQVSKASLRKGLDVSRLTSYAGRRNRKQEYLITSDQEKRGTPLIADLSFPDMAIVGFSDGSVRQLSRKELGLGPDDPIVAGDASKSDLLKKLSSK